MITNIIYGLFCFPLVSRFYCKQSCFDEQDCSKGTHMLHSFAMMASSDAAKTSLILEDDSTTT